MQTRAGFCSRGGDRFVSQAGALVESFKNLRLKDGIEIALI